MHPEVILNEDAEVTGQNNPTCWLQKRREGVNEGDDGCFKINIPNRKNPSDWRFIFGNINTLGDCTNKSNDMKWDQLKFLTDEAIPDVLGLSEHNRVILRMTRENRPQEVMGRWHPRTVCRFTWLQNKQNVTSYEVGGTGLVT